MSRPSRRLLFAVWFKPCHKCRSAHSSKLGPEAWLTFFFSAEQKTLFHLPCPYLPRPCIHLEVERRSITETRKRGGRYPFSSAPPLLKSARTRSGQECCGGERFVLETVEGGSVATLCPWLRLTSSGVQARSD